MSRFGFSAPRINIPSSVSGPLKSYAEKAKKDVTQVAQKKIAEMGIDIPSIDSIKAQVLSKIPEEDLAELKAAGITEDMIVDSVKEQMPHIPSVDELKTSIKNFKMPTKDDASKFVTGKINEVKDAYSTAKDIYAVSKGEMSINELAEKEMQKSEQSNV